MLQQLMLTQKKLKNTIKNYNRYYKKYQKKDSLHLMSDGNDKIGKGEIIIKYAAY